MWRISHEQMDALAERTSVQFDEAMRRHLVGFNPVLCRIAGHDAVLQMIRDGRRRAEAYGLRQSNTIRLFLELMLVFGHRFDDDPLIPWARITLLDRSIVDEDARADTLFGDVQRYLDRVVGPANEHLLAALHRVREVPIAWLMSADPRPAPMIAALSHLYPEKCRTVDDAALEHLYAEAGDWATRERLTASWAPAVLATLAFFFGHAVATDPFFAWIPRTLAQRSAGDDPAGDLFRAAQVYCAHTIDYLGKARDG